MDYTNLFGGTGGAHRNNSTGQQHQQHHRHHHHLPNHQHDFDYDFTLHQQRLSAAAAAAAAATAAITTATTADQRHLYQDNSHHHHHHHQQQQQQQQEENQLLRQRLEQVQAQMQAAQQQCLILQQQQQGQRKKQKHTVQEEDQTESEEEEEVEDSDNDDDEEEEDDDDEEEDEDDNDDNDNETTQHQRKEQRHRSNNNNNNDNSIGKSTYGNRQDPIKTPKTNMIDGRSNAKQAFEEKCNLLRQFISEHGHANVPSQYNKSLSPKWLFLSKWLEKQFKYYRGMKNGKVCNSKSLGGGCMTMERAQMLKDLGVNLDARTNVEEAIHSFHYVHFPTLQQFYTTFGHTCVPAVVNIHGVTSSNNATAAAGGGIVAAPFMDPEFKKWVGVNKVNLRNAKAYDLLMQQKNSPQQHEQQQAAGGGDSNAESAGALQEGGEPTDENDTNNNHDHNNNNDNVESTTTDNKNNNNNNQEAASDSNNNNNNNNQSDAAATEKKKKRKREGVERAELKRAYWTDEMTQKLQSLNCPWMNDACENEIKTYFKEINEAAPVPLPNNNPTKKKRSKAKGTSFLTFPTLNTQVWYENVELFRKYVQDHNGNGLVPVSSRDSMSGRDGRLGRFVKDQRKLYDAIQANIIPTHPIVEQNFALLKSIGFVFDAEILRQDEERRCLEKMNQVRAEKEKDSPWVKLEQEKKAVQEAKEAVAKAKAVVNEAQKALSQAQRDLQTAHKRVRDQQEVVSNDPVGKIVNVKSRSDTKPGGRARVVALNKVKIVQQDVTFYDLEYIDNDDKADEDKGDDGDKDKNNSNSSRADETVKVPRREHAVDAMFITFEDARFDCNGNIVVAIVAQPKSPTADGAGGPNLRRSNRKQQQQQSSSVIIAPGFHNLMLPPNSRMTGSIEAGQTDDYEDGMSMCI